MRFLLLVSVFLGWSASAGAQNFEMFEPNGLVVADVEIGPGRLVMHEYAGSRLYFSREPSYDSFDGRFVGYFQFELNRILRFPRGGFGAMQTADLDDFAPNFRITRRQVRPAGRRRAGPIPGPGYVGPGYIGPGHIHPGLIGPGPIGPVIIGPTGFGPFVPTPSLGFPTGPALPQSVVLDSQTIPNPPLSPVAVQLRNGGPRDIQVGVVDLQNPPKTRAVRIAAGGITTVTLERDAGARQVQNIRVVTPLGDLETREIVNDVPPSVRYEIVVHEWKIQSVAIDRTAGAGENPIEDINVHGKGMGRFPLPPGDELKAGSIDVYRAARSQGNPDAVAPILAEEDDFDSGPDPLERAILEAQQNAQRGR
ncbi:hypothetical protein Poly51_15220 [Rubripirellula tenax]|uniref:Uncharacterized protein n=2 Tax=Rubripirellula tenax TaxID=2528015 RepID=A0A5C6FDC4_9BACT|nr:hypothetical protein Poly51_15220 [Rubripirellula tenax]